MARTKLNTYERTARSRQEELTQPTNQPMKPDISISTAEKATVTLTSCELQAVIEGVRKEQSVPVSLVRKRLSPEARAQAEDRYELLQALIRKLEALRFNEGYKIQAVG